MKKLSFRHSLNLIFFLGAIAVGCEPVFDIPRGYNVTDKPLLFKVSMDRPATKASEITTANISSFEATAYPANTASSAYFSANTFTGSGSPKVFSAAGDLSWPDVALDFYAWSAGSGSSQVSKTAYNTFTVTPSTSPSSQVDLVFACAKNQSLSSVTDGVLPLNFRHTESRIAVKVKNTGSKYRFVVSAWKVGYLDNSATFVHDGSSTASSGTFPASCWTNNTSPSVSNSYQYTLSSSVNVPATAATVVNLDGDMIVIPQSVTKATAYQSTSAGAVPNGSYVAVKMKIIDAATEKVVFADGSGNPIWAIWPIAFDWVPGFKYTYSIDLSRGAYYESNPVSGTSDLFPFNDKTVGVSVTVSDFEDGEEISLPSTLPSFFAGLQISQGPLRYVGVMGDGYYEMTDSWTVCSYGSTYYVNDGSTYFRFNDMGWLFEIDGFGGGDGSIENLKRPFGDWRLPTRAEWKKIIGTDRSGATVNDVAGRHYSYVRLTGINHAGTSTPYGLILFPDDRIIKTDAISNFDNGTLTTGVTVDALNELLEQGCAFLPASGYFKETTLSSTTRWYNGTSESNYWSSTQYSASSSYSDGAGYYLWINYSSSSGASMDADGDANRVSTYMQARLVRPKTSFKKKTFGGLMIAPAPLKYTSKFEIVDNDWNHDSYNSTRGKNNGSYYFQRMTNETMGTVSYGGYSDWHIPTSTEMSTIKSTSRDGSTVNGTSSRHYAYVKVSDVTHAGASNPLGILLFPDGEDIYGTTLTYMDSETGTNTITNTQLNEYLDQGCVFIPASGGYDTVWAHNGTHIKLWCSDRRGTSGSDYFCIDVSDTNSLSGFDNKWVTYSNSSYYYPIRLVRNAN